MNTIAILMLLTGNLVFASVASSNDNTIGGSVTRGNTRIQLACENTDCSLSKLVYYKVDEGGGLTWYSETVGKLDIAKLRKYKFPKKLTDEESSVKGANEALTLFGKLVRGWIDYPVAIIRDNKKKRVKKLGAKELQNGLEFLLDETKNGQNLNLVRRGAYLTDLLKVLESAIRPEVDYTNNDCFEIESSKICSGEITLDSTILSINEDIFTLESNYNDGKIVRVHADEIFFSNGCIEGICVGDRVALRRSLNNPRLIEKIAPTQGKLQLKNGVFHKAQDVFELTGCDKFCVGDLVEVVDGYTIYKSLVHGFNSNTGEIAMKINGYYRIYKDNKIEKVNE